MRRRHFPGHRHGNRAGLAMLLLAGQLMQVGFDRIPPATLVTLLGQVFIFLNPLRLGFPSISAVCISGVNVWYKEDFKRLIFASFFHLDEWHLYYNMVSFLWKGISLEKKLGTSYFAYMIAVFAVLCNFTTVALGIFAENLTGDVTYIQQCAAGFSGVLFALKVATTHMMPPGIQRVMGFIPVHSRIACWVELLVIHILVPNSSFLGHLAGILVGLLYVKGPLKLLMNQLHAPGHYTYTRGTATYNTRNVREDSRPTGSQSLNFSAPSGYTTGGVSANQPYRAERAQPPAPAFQDADYSARSPTLPPRYGQPGSYEERSSAPPYPTSDGSPSRRLYPDLNEDTAAQAQRENDLNEMRQRRLARFT